MRKGSKMSAESRARMSAAHKHRRVQGFPGNRLGKPHSDHSRALISKHTRENTARGPDHYAWRGGITPSRRKGRKIPSYKAWRKAVREQADDACEGCQCHHAGRMVAHHIKSFAEYPSLATDPHNGAWLCDDCHRNVHAV